MSRADLNFAAQLAASSLLVAGYSTDSPRGKASAALREMLSDDLAGFMVEVFGEMKKARARYVLPASVPPHVLMQEALQEIGS